MTGNLNVSRWLGNCDILPGVIIFAFSFLQSLIPINQLHWISNVHKALGEYYALSGVIFIRVYLIIQSQNINE